MTILNCNLPWVDTCWIVSQSCKGSLFERQNPMRTRVLRRGTDALCRRNGTWSGPRGPSIGVCSLCLRLGEVSLRLSSRNGLRHTVCRVPRQDLQAHLQLRRQVRAEWDGVKAPGSRAPGRGPGQPSRTPSPPAFQATGVLLCPLSQQDSSSSHLPSEGRNLSSRQSFSDPG